MSGEYECTSCGKILSDGEKHNFHDCYEFIKGENKYLKTVIKGLRSLDGDENKKLRTALKDAYQDTENIWLELNLAIAAGFKASIEIENIYRTHQRFENRLMELLGEA